MSNCDTSEMSRASTLAQPMPLRSRAAAIRRYVSSEPTWTPQDSVPYPDGTIAMDSTSPALAAQSFDTRASATTSIEDTFCAVLASAGMRQALGVINARTRYRFTGLYRVEPPALRNEYLFDRENPTLSLGGDVTPLSDTYCGVVAEAREPFVTVDATADPRLIAHPARQSVISYVGVPIRGSDGRIFGTLCHFDFRPRILPADEVVVLESISKCVSRWLAKTGLTTTRTER